MTTLIEGVDYTVDGVGNYTFSAALVGTPVTVTYQGVNTASAVSALNEAGLNLTNGTLGQATWGYLAGAFPAQALGYSGFAYVFAPAYDLGSTAEVVNHTFEVSTPWEQDYTPDASPGAVIQDLLFNSRYGMDFPASRTGEVSDIANYARAQGLSYSPVLSVQKPGAEWLRYLLDLCNSDCVWSQATLKFVPLGDKAVTANGATYTPNNVPVYELTEDHFVVSGPDEDGVKVSRKSNEDAYNHVRVEYSNRANDYNLDIVEAKDSADIDYRGLRTMATFEAHAICDTAVARTLATLLLNRQMSVRNTYKFTLPWSFVMAEPLDLLSLTYAPKGLDGTPVRINTISEQNDGDYEYECEDAPIGMATSPAYGAEAGEGFSHNYNTPPGSVETPVFFEAPVERTVAGLEVYIAVGGSGLNWGGCRVWVALDGEANYQEVDRLVGSSRYGYVSANMADSDTSVNIQLKASSGPLTAGSAADAAALNTLVWLEGATPGGEYMAHEGAALIGSNAYTLSGLVRGGFDTVPQAHPLNSAMVRVDEALAKSGALDISYVGKPLSFKFTSFNVYGGGEQTLDEVVEYTYTITGAMLDIPPPNFDFFNITIQPDGTRQFEFAYISTPRPVDFLGAQIRYLPGLLVEPAWDTMERLDNLPDNGFYSQSPVESNSLLAGDYTFALCAIDRVFNASVTPLYIQVTLPNRRLGSVFDEFYEHSEGWTGTKTDCHVAGSALEADDTADWTSTPNDWATHGRWNSAPVSPIYYETPARDLGATISARINSSVDADGIVVQELALSGDGVSWSAWGDPSAPFNSRYFKLRLTVTATVPDPVPFVRTWSYAIDAAIQTEYINDLDISTLTGSYRIGTGDIRIPLANAYAVIRNTNVIIQDSSSGSWTAQRIDNVLTYGPRWQFKLNGTLTDPTSVDFIIEGYPL